MKDGGRQRILFPIFQETNIENYYVIFVWMKIQCSLLFQKEMLRAIKQGKNKLKKREKWLCDFHPNLRPPPQGLQIPVTPQMTLSTRLSKKSILSKFHIKEIHVCQPFKMRKNVYMVT